MRSKTGFLYSFMIIILFTAFACGSEGSNNKESASSVKAIEPDPAYSGNDCSCGGKTSDGSGMTLSASGQLFPLFKGNRFIPGQILVKFKDGTTQARTARIMNSVGSTLIRNLLFNGTRKNSLLKKIKIEENKTVDAALKEYKNMPEVEYAEPNYIYHSLNTSSADPDYSLQWGLHNTGQTVNDVAGTSGKDIDAEAAWDTITACSDVIVAVLDTGINYNHRDLSTNMWDGGTSYPDHGYDFVDDDNDPMDLNGHGTHCAGIIGANGGNNKGLAGLCWAVKLMAVRVLDATGSGTVADIADGITFAVDNGAHIISASLGSATDSQTLKNAVAYAYNHGVIFIAAAGNDGDTTYTYPAAYGTVYDNVISVAAADQDGNLADFSNYGTDWVDIAAPGVNILSTWPGQHVLTAENFSGWVKESGWGTGTYAYTSSGNGSSMDFAMLTNPSKFGSETYAANLQSMAYANFDLNAYSPDAVVASFYADFYLESSDGFGFLYNVNGGRPDPYDSDAYLFFYTGNTGGLCYMGEYDFTSVMANDTGLGFFIYSNSSVQYQGAGVALFNISRLYGNTTACLYASGTSMAAPHVSGVAAMCIQYYINRHGSYSNTGNYTYIINAILNGACTYSSLNNYVASGRMLSASGALSQVP